MLNLKIETTNKYRAGDIENAYNIALNTTNLDDFMKSLSDNIGNSIVGKGGNHIWIAEQKEGDEGTSVVDRIAIIEL